MIIDWLFMKLFECMNAMKCNLLTIIAAKLTKLRFNIRLILDNRNGKSGSRINGRQKMEKINDSIQLSGANTTTRLEFVRNVLFL